MCGHAVTHVQEMSWILQRCRMSGVATRESQSQSCSQGLGSSAVEGTPRLTQGMGQAMDVQMADVQIAAVQSDMQPPSERVAYRAALQVVPPALSAMEAVPTEVQSGQPMAGRSHRAVRKPQTLRQCSYGPRRSCWSWRRHCQRCALSGTSRGACSCSPPNQTEQSQIQDMPCSAACARDVVDLQSCWMTGVASHESKCQSRSEGPVAQATSATPPAYFGPGTGNGRPDGGRGLRRNGLLRSSCLPRRAA